VTIRGFEVAGGTIGVHVVDSTKTAVRDVRVAGSGEGVRMRRCHQDCEVSGSTVEGTTRGPGIRLRDSHAATVSDNVVIGSRRDGVRIARCEQLSFSENRVERSGADGIRIVRCDRVRELESNVATANRGSGLRLERGFVAGWCSECNVDDNVTDRNGRHGIRVRGWSRIDAPDDLAERDNTASGNRGADFRVRSLPPDSRPP
jgi:parallel beta-helix repeat protein